MFKELASEYRPQIPSLQRTRHDRRGLLTDLSFRLKLKMWGSSLICTSRKPEPVNLAARTLCLFSQFCCYIYQFTDRSFVFPPAGNGIEGR
jgi:hypothetical protein